MNQESIGVNYSLALKNFYQDGSERLMRKFYEHYWQRNDEKGNPIRIGRVASDEKGYGKW